MAIKLQEPDVTLKETEARSAPAHGADPLAITTVGVSAPLKWPDIGPVLLITLLGLAFRLWGIRWSLPDTLHPLATYHPDELINLNAARMADIPHLKFDIGFYNYGAFYSYLVSFAHTFGRGYGIIPPHVAVPGAPLPEQWQAALPEQSALFLAGRIVTALLGAATIPVVFALGRRMYGQKTGLFAALLLGIAPLAVVHSHFLTVDIPATFFVSLALLWSARLLERESWQDYALAALWTGLAAATKYNAGLVIIAPIFAHTLRYIPNACSRHRAGQLVVLLCLTAITFLIACPGPILNLDAFWNGLPGYPGSGVRYELFEHSRTGHGYLFVNTGPGWWYHAVISLPYGLGLFLCIFAYAGIFYSCRRHTRADWVLLAFLALYFGTTGLSAVRFARYMLPLFPVLCLLTARLMVSPFDKPRAAILGRAFSFIVVAITTAYSYGLVSQMARKDPRDSAADYLNTTVPQGGSIAFATIPWFYSPPLSPYFGAPSAATRAHAVAVTTRYNLRFPTQKPEWDISVLTPLPDAVALSNIETMHPLDRLHLPEPVNFLQSIPKYYRQVRFTHSPIFGLPANQKIIPEDLLYIMPTITVYQK